MGYVSRNAKPLGKNLKIFQGPAILLVRKGIAGHMTYIEKREFTTNDDAYVLMPRKAWKDKIILRWFASQYQELFYNLVTSKSDNATFNKQYAEKQKVKIPDIKSVQLRLIGKKKSLEIIYFKVLKLIRHLKDSVRNTKMYLEDGQSENLDNIFQFKGGNSGLTEEFIYNNQPNNEEEKIPILSSATLDINLMGYISRNAKPNGKNLKIFRGPCILVARNGYAGTMAYIESREFTTNDHAYVLTSKKEWKDNINLRWFVYQYQELFYNLVTSKSDNATFSKEYAEKLKVKIPDVKIQNPITGKLLKADRLIQNLKEIKKEINGSIECEIM